MLVLSRRPDEKIVFPNLNVSVQVLQVRGQAVKLGISAPSEVKVLRPEACAEGELETLQRNAATHLDPHKLRNRLNVISLGMVLFQKQTEQGSHADAQETLDRVLSELMAMDAEIGTAKGVKSTRRLLVVEDDANERELLAGLLRLHGFEVEAVSDGQEALDYLHSHEPPAFVLLDMRMPRCNGVEALQQIRSDERLKALKVFAVSGSRPMRDRPGKEPHFDGWFSKPLNPAELLRAIETPVGAK